MKIGLIDVDGHNFPNIALMKISAWHKNQGDSVEWYVPLLHSMGEPFDVVYMSKVFSFTPDYQYHVNAIKTIKGGSGYAISLIDGKVYTAEDIGGGVKGDHVDIFVDTHEETLAGGVKYKDVKVIRR